jgi:hypothetical protein
LGKTLHQKSTSTLSHGVNDRIAGDHRFENHKNGYKSARLVRKYGVRLLPELFEHLNPMPYEHAVQMEKDLADDLRAQGYAVCGGT